MKNERVLVVTLLVSGLGIARPAFAAREALSAPEVPATLRTPAGTKVVARFHATGAQVYACTATTSKPGWTLKRPDATLLDATGAPAGTHGAGPTWTSKDGSAVVGEKVAQSDAPVADAVPWLLLRATSTSGRGRFTDVTYVQRVGTKGGKAPATGCDAGKLGTELRVTYSADYYFFSGGAKPDKP